jgi:hypothetical protein
MPIFQGKVKVGFAGASGDQFSFRRKKKMQTATTMTATTATVHPGAHSAPVLISGLN